MSERIQRNGWSLEGTVLTSPSGNSFHYPTREMALEWFADSSAECEERTRFDRALRRANSNAGRRAVIDEHVQVALADLDEEQT